MSVPTPEQQVAFLGHLQRLLAEGGFTATYKHALLLALADLALDLGDASGAPLVVPVSAIAEKCIAYYWRQTLPYPTFGDETAVLKQNTHKQAAIVRLVADAQAVVGSSLAAAQRNPLVWERLVADVGRVVKAMPLWKLQRVGPDAVIDFLYPNTGSGDEVELRPGVAFCLRRFHGLVTDLVRGAWIRFVRGLRENQALLGDTTNLDEFLFGSERADLSVYRQTLIEVQHGECFYCHRRVDGAGAVDHFIPWSRYPNDLGHNFVLADATCNGKKADRLASVEHLGRWCERNALHGPTLDNAFAAKSIPADRAASSRIARWAYEQTEMTGGLVWVSGDNLVTLDVAWRALLVEAA